MKTELHAQRGRMGAYAIYLDGAGFVSKLENGAISFSESVREAGIFGSPGATCYEAQSLSYSYGSTAAVVCLPFCGFPCRAQKTGYLIYSDAHGFLSHAPTKASFNLETAVLSPNEPWAYSLAELSPWNRFGPSIAVLLVAVYRKGLLETNRGRTGGDHVRLHDLP